jgi:hypothetical protein
VCCAITDIARQAREAFIRQEYGPGQMAEFDWGELLKMNMVKRQQN